MDSQDKLFFYVVAIIAVVLVFLLGFSVPNCNKQMTDKDAKQVECIKSCFESNRQDCGAVCKLH